ncbi:NUDIX domain-containing protein [Solibacillus sp. FSL W8-0372]|uniref:NUDIX domain-containing protein n=1 Tax=Solibacillus sp. FSL W8-0372 TaxID=2921713 RepID=UPI0030CECF9E
MKTVYVNWGGNKVKLTWIPGMEINQSIKVTSVHSICIKDDNILLVDIKHRGFNFPGGHLEAGEKIEEAILRETYEEGYVNGKIQYIGSIEVSHEENPSFNPNGKYPMIGYQAFYRMDVNECFPFFREHESNTRIWVKPTEVPFVINDHELTKLILEDAITLL